MKDVLPAFESSESRPVSSPEVAAAAAAAARSVDAALVGSFACSWPSAVGSKGGAEPDKPPYGEESVEGC